MHAEHTTLDVVLPYTVSAYNTAQMTPFRLVHGREATPALDAILQTSPMRTTSMSTPTFSMENPDDLPSYGSRTNSAPTHGATTYADGTRNTSRMTVYGWSREFAAGYGLKNY